MASQSTLPQGFSVYQPSLGAQLQFFPAVGTQQLDEMIHAFVPGQASTQEKRATVSLDFLEYTQLTGQSFKFYPVYTLAESPATDSGSSFNVSPVTPNWDFSQASSSRSSAQPRKAHKAASRHQPTDFSHLPGMQIMTKDGQDVTNSASRGSKTKEQRDHAHLMRVIKACEACRRRKTRCDPSHKKRTATQVQSQAQSAPKAKKARMSTAPSIALDEAPVASPFEFDASFTGLEDVDFSQDWDQFVQYPADVAEDYDFFLDPEGFLSSESSQSSSSPFKSLSPTSQESVGVSPSEMLNPELQATSPQLPYLDQGGNYADFNLFSPESSFSEDDLMIPIQASSGLANMNPPLDPRRLPPVQPPFYQGGVNESRVTSELYDGHQYYDPGRQDVDTGVDYGINVDSRSGAAVELSMRVLGEANSFAGDLAGQALANVVDRNVLGTISASSGLATSETTAVSDLRSTAIVESTASVAPEFTRVEDLRDEQSMPGSVRATAVATQSTQSAQSGARAVANRGSSGVLTQLATSLDVNELTRTVVATRGVDVVSNVAQNAVSNGTDAPDRSSSSIAASSAYALTVQTHNSDLSDVVLSVENTMPVSAETQPQLGPATGEDADVSYGNSEVVSRLAVFVHNIVGLESTTTMAPLSSVVVLLGAFTLMLYATKTFGLPSLYAIGLVVMSVANRLCLDVSRRLKPSTDTTANNDEYELSTPLADMLRSRAANIIGSQTQAPFGAGRWRNSRIGCI